MKLGQNSYVACFTHVDKYLHMSKEEVRATTLMDKNPEGFSIDNSET
jgi:hypothetical protein